MSDEKVEKHESRGLSAKYVLHGDDSHIKYLITHRDDPKDGKLIVFIDDELDLDWECDDIADGLLEPCRNAIREVMNDVAAVEPLVQSWPNDLKMTSKRLLGEALASALRGDVESAKGALANARKFVKDKGKQVSRYWTLQGCIVTGGVAFFLGTLEILARAWFMQNVGRTPTLLSLCFFSGCVGALFFVIMRLGAQPVVVDSTAERHLHYLESFARITAGGIAGVLVGGMVILGLVLPVFGRAGFESVAMCIAAMIAGASERLAAGIITKTEHAETTKKENHNADK